jgi:hypothetical protein
MKRTAALAAGMLVALLPATAANAFWRTTGAGTGHAVAGSWTSSTLTFTSLEDSTQGNTKVTASGGYSAIPGAITVVFYTSTSSTVCAGLIARDTNTAAKTSATWSTTSANTGRGQVCAIVSAAGVPSMQYGPITVG